MSVCTPRPTRTPLVDTFDTSVRPYDPHAHAAHLGLEVVRVPLQGDLVGVTDCKTTIWINERCGQRMTRSSIAHEIAHAVLGLLGGGPTGQRVKRVENACDVQAAKWLITVDELIDAARWADSLDEMADVLTVRMSMITARLSALTDAEDRRFYRAISGRQITREVGLRR